MENIFLETERLILREMNEFDFSELALMLKDPEVMYAWEYTFDDIDVMDWIKKNRGYYKKFGLGYFLAIDKNSNKVVGQLAILPDTINGKKYLEIGYILKKDCLKQGYAIEGAKALCQYVFKILNKSEVIFEIRPENSASRKVAEKLGAKVKGSFTKNVRGKEMKHLIYKLFMVN